MCFIDCRIGENRSLIRQVHFQLKHPKERQVMHAALSPRSAGGAEFTRWSSLLRGLVILSGPILPYHGGRKRAVSHAQVLENFIVKELAEALTGDASDNLSE